MHIPRAHVDGAAFIVLDRIQVNHLAQMLNMFAPGADERAAPRFPRSPRPTLAPFLKAMAAMKTFFFLLLASLVTATMAIVVNASAQPKDAAKGDIEHGRYLVEHVAMCAECHSPRDINGNIVDELRFTGAPIPVRPPWPNDWAIAAPRNRGLPGYTVEQGIRLLTEGAIGRDGRQLKPPMPRFRMTHQDAADVVAYMKSMQ
jgi:mono/diheme cytochrome c family protein